MIYRLIKSMLEARAAVRRDADALIAAHGKESWSVARSLAFKAMEGSERADRAWQVVHRIERRLKIYR